MKRAEAVIRSELERRCDEVLHYLWDPIGVACEPGARDEYAGYVPHVCALLRSGAEQAELVAYLDSAAGGAMGVTPAADSAVEAARVLIEWRDWLDEAPLSEDDFWLRLEFRLCREFDRNESWRSLGLWCDGIHPNRWTLDASPQRIEGEAWIGIGPKDQERWTFRLELPEQVDRRSAIEWSRLLPPDNVTGWLAADPDGRCLRIAPGAGIAEED